MSESGKELFSVVDLQPELEAKERQIAAIDSSLKKVPILFPTPCLRMLARDKMMEKWCHYLGRRPMAGAAPIVMSTVFFSRTLFPAAGQISANESIELKFGTHLEEDFCSSDTKNLSNRMLTG